jgi:iron complex outermembrane receptor protein
MHSTRYRARIRFAHFVGVLAATSVFHAAGLRAQTSTAPPTAGGAVERAALAVTVIDTTGAPIPGAIVTVASEERGTAVVAVSDEQTIYRADSLAPGPYRLEIVLDGFDTESRRIVLAAGQRLAETVSLVLSRQTQQVVVTARRVEEVVQEVPIPVSVVDGTLAEAVGAFNMNRVKDLIPAVQFYSSNPRNSTVNIRGLGAPFGLTNDGIEAGVGLYVDGVFFARPAAATLDFLDVERIEVLRGPQGTLFGKNTTAGAINVTTRKPSFTPKTDVELNYGNFGYLQAKGSVTGPLGSQKLAGRLSFSGTERGGVIEHVRTDEAVNDLSNLGLRGQLLYAPSDRLGVTLAIDHTRQRPRGYTQVPAGVAPTLRPANRQYAQIAEDLNYVAPSMNGFDRLTDVDTALQSFQDLGGAGLTLDWKLGPGRLSATTGWRYWNWNPSNDRDFIGLPVTTISAAPSAQRQLTQEVRYAATVSPRLDLVAGGFAFKQTINSDPSFKQEQGSAAWRFLLAPTPAAATPGLLDGYGYNQRMSYGNVSAAVFGQVEWTVNDRLRLLPGLRFNYDQKDVDFDQQVYGGLQTGDPVLLALKLSVLAPQAYTADVDDTNTSGQISIAYKAARAINTYATVATGFKSIGLNLNGLPTDALGNPILGAATVRPEDVLHFEAGIKTEPFRNATANLTIYDTEVKDFQAQVVNASVGVLRGYLANAEKVRVRGAEFDGSARIGERLSLYSAVALTDGRYVSFPDAPPPLEETGGPQVKDISGSRLPGISTWALSLGGEWSIASSLFGRSGDVFVGVDTSYRSSFSSSATPSRYLVIDGYSLLNPRVGVRWKDGWSVSLWSRNVLNTNYYELLSAQPGNSGLYVGQPGDARTIGVALKLTLAGS